MEANKQLDATTVKEIYNYINTADNELRQHFKLALEKINAFSKLEKIERYIHLLHDTQRSGHEVHKELDDALKLYKQVAGI